MTIVHDGTIRILDNVSSSQAALQITLVSQTTPASQSHPPVVSLAHDTGIRVGKPCRAALSMLADRRAVTAILAANSRRLRGARSGFASVLLHFRPGGKLPAP